MYETSKIKSRKIQQPQKNLLQLYIDESFQYDYCIIIFFDWDSLHARLNSHYHALSYKKKKDKKNYAIYQNNE